LMSVSADSAAVRTDDKMECWPVQHTAHASVQHCALMIKWSAGQCNTRQYYP
jgi:hypothetical protein